VIYFARNKEATALFLYVCDASVSLYLLYVINDKSIALGLRCYGGEVTFIYDLIKIQECYVLL
jgi:hypothetical protein